LTADNDDDFTIAEAVAVRGNRILAVGTSDRIRRLTGPATRVIDLKGRSLTPGFIYNDGDNSVPAGDILKDSMWEGRIQAHLGGKTLDEALATLSTIVATHGKPGEPLFIKLQDQWAGKVMQDWNRATLDEVAPDNPIIVYLDANLALANKAMIELAIREGLPPDHFHLDRDSSGDFTGWTGAQVSGFIGREVRPWPEPSWFDEVAIPMAVESLANYARHGVTVATGHMSAATLTILNRLFHEQPQDLKVRVYPGLDFLRQNPNPEMYLKRIGNLVDFSLEDARGPMVTIVGASVGPHTGAPDGPISLLTIRPKTNVIPVLSPNTNGFNSWTAQSFTGLKQEDLTPEQLKQTDYYNIILARQHGWNVTGIHNMGSEGIRLAMQAVVEAEQQDKLYVKKLWRPQSFDHNIEWVPEVYDYYAAHPVLKDILRVGVNLRIVIKQRDAAPLNIKDVIEAQWGMAGLERMAPLNTLLQKGIPFHIEGTEPGDEDASPTWYIQKAVTRVDRHGRVIAASEALDRKTAFLALTRWPARFIGAESDIGSIQPGMLADLVVFDGNILDVPIDGLAELRPLLTLVGGQVAYEAEGL
jgi:predicted amidohydrolase YtcJ